MFFRTFAKLGSFTGTGCSPGMPEQIRHFSRPALSLATVNDRENGFFETIIRRLAPAAAALVVFFVVSAAYFAPQFRGEVLPQHDVVQYEGMAKDISDMRAATGEDPQWTGGMFGGMPAFLINVAYPAQIVKRTVGQVVKLIDTPAAFLFFAMTAMWLMLLVFGVTPGSASSRRWPTGSRPISC